MSKRPKEKSFVMDLFSRINSGRNLLDNLTEKLLPFIQKSILRSNSHTELNRLFLSAEMAVLDAQPVCSIGDEFILSLAYLDWLFSLPPPYHSVRFRLASFQQSVPRMSTPSSLS